jgi:Family of unknown function (DUF6065)
MLIQAYNLNDPGEDACITLRQPAAKRAWLPEFAYRCTPLAIANRSGIELCLRWGVSMRWDGGDTIQSLEIVPETELIASHFGSGIVSFVIPYLFKTPRSWSLWVLGPANDPMDGIAPLEGVVETAWSSMTFTMNWRMTAIDQWVHFVSGQAIGRVVPVRISAMRELWLEEKGKMDLPPRKRRAYDAWAKNRDAFLERLKKRDREAEQQGWQKTYHRGARHKLLKAARIKTLAP